MPEKLNNEKRLWPFIIIVLCATLYKETLKHLAAFSSCCNLNTSKSNQPNQVVTCWGFFNWKKKNHRKCFLFGFYSGVIYYNISGMEIIIIKFYYILSLQLFINHCLLHVWHTTLDLTLLYFYHTYFDCWSRVALTNHRVKQHCDAATASVW